MSATDPGINDLRKIVSATDPGINDLQEIVGAMNHGINDLQEIVSAMNHGTNHLGEILSAVIHGISAATHERTHLTEAVIAQRNVVRRTQEVVGQPSSVPDSSGHVVELLPVMADRARGIVAHHKEVEN